MTSTQPSVEEISKSVRRAFQTLLKFWGSTGIHAPPCSWHRAASLISGSQKPSHWQAASHSFRQDWHVAPASSGPLQTFTQKWGCFLQFASHDALVSSGTGPGQNAARQLAAEAASSTRPPSAPMAEPPQGITRVRVMAALYLMPTSSAARASSESVLEPAQLCGSSASVSYLLGQSHSGASPLSCRPQRPTQIGVSADTRCQANVMSGWLCSQFTPAVGQGQGRLSWIHAPCPLPELRYMPLGHAECSWLSETFGLRQSGVAGVAEPRSFSKAIGVAPTEQL
mmetsp:Transcript_13377/g.38036  ORF Transcript_13377/g.38036 Transcript_13377/m.38036 type:complete len:283 (+) Transcript_13377:1840-2688(+)